MSGQRRSTRLESDARPLDAGKIPGSRGTDRADGEINHQRRWRRYQAHRDVGARHADRAQRVCIVIVGVGGRTAVVMRSCREELADRSSTNGLAVEGMNVAEGQRQVDDQRNQRQPRSPPDIVPKPAHVQVRLIIPRGPNTSAILSKRIGPSILTPVTTLGANFLPSFDRRRHDDLATIAPRRVLAAIAPSTIWHRCSRLPAARPARRGASERLRHRWSRLTAQRKLPRRPERYSGATSGGTADHRSRVSASLSSA